MITPPENVIYVPNARIHHLKTPKPISIHGKTLFVCQYSGDLVSHAYTVPGANGVRLGSFRDIPCLLSFLTSIYNNPKCALKEKYMALEWFSNICNDLKITNPVLAPTPLDMQRFGGNVGVDTFVQSYDSDLAGVDDKAKEEYEIDENVDENKPAKKKVDKLKDDYKVEFKCPMDLETTDEYYIVEGKNATLASFFQNLRLLFGDRNDITSEVKFKKVDDVHHVFYFKFFSEHSDGYAPSVLELRGKKLKPGEVPVAPVEEEVLEEGEIPPEKIVEVKKERPKRQKKPLSEKVEKLTKIYDKKYKEATKDLYDPEPVAKNTRASKKRKLNPQPVC